MNEETYEKDLIDLVLRINQELYPDNNPEDRRFGELIFSSNYYVESIHLGDVELWCSETHDSEFNIASIEKAVRARLKEMLGFFAQAKQP